VGDSCRRLERLIERLLEIAGDVPAVNLGEAKVEEVGYGPARLLAYEKVGADVALRLYGRVIRRLLKMRRLDRGSAEEAIREELRQMGLDRSFYGDLVALVYDDLRRMGIVAIGQGGPWPAQKEATPTALGEQLRRCLDVPRDEDLGAFAVAFCYVRSWPLDSQEAGFCTALSDGRLPEGHEPLVRRAVELFYNNAPPACIPYASDMAKAKALLTRAVVQSL
jgi:hypothetical protein